jgi:hypothetical protein
VRLLKILGRFTRSPVFIFTACAAAFISIVAYKPSAWSIIIALAILACFALWQAQQLWPQASFRDLVLWYLSGGRKHPR